jgi:hypothetical protein
VILVPEGLAKYYLSYRGRIMLVSKNQLRPASSEESAAWENIGEEVKMAQETMKQDEKGFEDVSEPAVPPPLWEP